MYPGRLNDDLEKILLYDFLTEAKEVALGGDVAGLSGIVFYIYTSAGYSLVTVSIELVVMMGGTLLAGGAGFGGGAFIRILIQRQCQTYIAFDGMLSNGWITVRSASCNLHLF